MPGQEWRKPGESPTEGLEKEAAPRARAHHPSGQVRRRVWTQPQLAEAPVDIGLDDTLDSSIRLVCASGDSPAEDKSYPNPLATPLPSSGRLSRSGVGRSKLVRMVVLTALVVAAVMLLIFPMQSTGLIFALGLGLFFGGSIYLAVLCHSRGERNGD